MATRSSTARSGTGEGQAVGHCAIGTASAPRGSWSISRRWPGVLPDRGSHNHAKVRIIIHRARFAVWLDLVRVIGYSRLRYRPAVGRSWALVIQRLGVGHALFRV